MVRLFPKAPPKSAMPLLGRSTRFCVSHLSCRFLRPLVETYPPISLSDRMLKLPLPLYLKSWLTVAEKIVARYMHRGRTDLSFSFCRPMGAEKVCLSYFLNPVRSRSLYYSPWAFYLPLFGTLINLGVLYWKRHSHPLNMVLLSTFTLMEAFTLGVVIAFYDTIIVLQAL
jgi:hypothetical protein